MPRHVEFETTIKGGLPVIVKATLYPPEPDVGIFDWQPEYALYWLNGGECHIHVKDEDHERIIDECLE